MVKIHNKSVEDFCKSYRGEKFHALFCDAPYELNFMGKSWDSSGVAFNPDTWSALAEHLLPGAFLFVFAGTLNDDLISVAMRQAGLRRFHKAINWAFGSGFPKASRIDSAVDRKAGANREARPYKYANRRHDKMGSGAGDNTYGTYSAIKLEYLPATPLAKAWAGHRYGLQALKPAAETILIFQKPYDGKAVDSIVKSGAGALNVDGARLKTKANNFLDKGRTATGVSLGWANTEHGEYFYDGSLGRWPANLLLQHDHRCNGTCHPDCVIAALDEQAGNRPSGWRKAGESWIRNGEITGFGGKYAEKCTGVVSRDYVSDSGGASRFFFNSDWSHEVQEQIENADAVRYQAKASRSERDAGLDGLLVKEYPYRQVNSKWKVDSRHQGGGYLTAPQPKARNNHPTVKPIGLCKYLATLLLPPSEYAPRRILVPFAGVASEAIGAMLAGWEDVVAVEKEKEYCEIGKARVKYWEKHRDPKVKPKRKTEPQEEMLQHSLF